MSKGRRSPTVTMTGWRGCGDSCSVTKLFVHRRDASVSARPAQVIAMDADDSSDDSRIVEQQQATRRKGRTICTGFVGLNHGLRSLDCVSLVNVFKVRPFVMKTIPPFVKGTFETALKASLQEIRWGQHSRDLTTEIRGWKLFFLHRPPRGGFVPKAQLQERVDK